MNPPVLLQAGGAAAGLIALAITVRRAGSMSREEVHALGALLAVIVTMHASWAIEWWSRREIIDAPTDYLRLLAPVFWLFFLYVSLRAMAGRELRASEEQHRAIFETAMDGLLIIDRNGRVVEANPEACRMHGMTREELIGSGPESFVHPDSYEKFAEFVREVSAGRRFQCIAKDIRKDGAEFIVEVQGAPFVIAGEHHLLGIVRDITEKVQGEQRMRFMMQELDHRVKNNLASVVSLAESTSRAVGSLGEFREVFGGRLRALSRTHTLLAQSKWRGMRMHELARSTLEGFADTKAGRTVTFEGPDCTLPARAAAPMSMTLHELATNAVKHGSLSMPEGRVEVRWSIEGPVNGPRSLRLTWRESDGPQPPQSPPAGFGRALIDGAIRHQLQGEVDFDFTPRGLVCTIVVNFERTREITLPRNGSGGAGEPGAGEGLSPPGA